jgi:1-phosphatidylinositol phosphodiesterase
MTDLVNWMSSVGGSKKLSELSIPGTHDSASRYIDPTNRTDPGTSPRLTTQTDGIPEQLFSGIRFLDIRVGYTGGEFKLYHEAVSLGLDFGDVRDFCKSFLQAHPRETIILSLKRENGAPTSGNTANVTFQARFNTYVAENPNLWYLGDTIPTLRSVRGKIVLFRRFDIARASPPTALGIDASDDFPPDARGTIDGPAKLEIQDKFDQTRAETTKETKWTAVVDLLNDASRQGSDRNTLFLNFGSAAGVAPVDFPLSVANFINPRLITYFNGHPRGRFGIVAMDFQTLELNALIVRTNGV